MSGLAGRCWAERGEWVGMEETVDRASSRRSPQLRDRAEQAQPLRVLVAELGGDVCPLL
jgi:hypothetical protein